MELFCVHSIDTQIQIYAPRWLVWTEENARAMFDLGLYVAVLGISVDDTAQLTGIQVDMTWLLFLSELRLMDYVVEIYENKPVDELARVAAKL